MVALQDASVEGASGSVSDTPQIEALQKPFWEKDIVALVQCSYCGKQYRSRSKIYRRKLRFCTVRCQKSSTENDRPSWGEPISAGNCTRFWDKVNKSGPISTHRPELGPCWIWIAAKDNSGYGLIGSAGVVLRAHRVSFELDGNSIPDTYQVLHKCDRPECVRPSHLFLGTQPENIADMVSKGRARGKTDQYGQNNCMAKITVDIVKQIRELNMTASQSEIADRFGISQSSVSLIVQRKTWTQVP